ncbi:MAG TPA: low-specificity L-threonine aldolase [Dehalococcoidia bacterium]|nr:low-specificity L-threonine aldolase [Dehalococcoidia bacterium]
MSETRDRIIDLRSDTVTVPSDAMRRAIAEAEVGDDVFGEDPTVRRLEQMAAERTGKEAAVFVASGTMSNLVAVLTHTRHGDEAICGSEAHVLHYEVSGAAALGGVQLRPVANDVRGRMNPTEVEATVRGENVHMPPTTLLLLENTHNRCSGAAIPLDDVRELSELAHRHGMKVHVDGARIFNAALALGVSVAELSAPADSVGFCLSKGLGAPVGSVLCGDGEFIARARKVRKMLGGGTRQAGIIAAAGVYALECMVDRLVEDHENAKLLARGLASLPNVELDPESIDTNIVIFGVRGDWLGFQRALKQAGVLSTVPRPGSIRMVTHFGIDRGDIEEALERAHHAAAAVA